MNANEPPTPEAEARLAAFLTAWLGRAPSSEALWQRLAPHLSAPSAPGEPDLMKPDKIPLSASTPAVQEPPQRLRAPAWRIIPTVAALVIIALVATVFAALHGYQKASVHTNGTPGISTGTGVPPGTVPQDVFYSASLSSPSEGWAVGDHRDVHADISTVNERSLLSHLVNGTWVPVALPANAPDDIRLQAVSFDAQNDGWAVGIHGLLHYTGATWDYVPSPFITQPSSVQMVAPNAGWILILNPKSQQKAIYFFDGTQWSPQAIPVQPDKVNLNLWDLSMLSPQEGWAVGDAYDTVSGTNLALILHWHDGQWSVQTSIANDFLRSISMTSPTEGWAAGVNHSGVPLVLHYHDGSWAPFHVDLYAADNGFLVVNGFTVVRMISPTDGWITGSSITPQDAQKSLILLHFDGTAWRQVPTPPLGAGRTQAIVASFAISGGAMWAVGYDAADGIAQGSTYAAKATPLIMQLVSGVWVVAQS